MPAAPPASDQCASQPHLNTLGCALEITRLQRRAGAKGFGLFALEDIKRGQFIIEYIGEVLDEEEYLRRKDFYAEVALAGAGDGGAGVECKQTEANHRWPISAHAGWTAAGNTTP